MSWSRMRDSKQWYPLFISDLLAAGKRYFNIKIVEINITYETMIWLTMEILICSETVFFGLIERDSQEKSINHGFKSVNHIHELISIFRNVNILEAQKQYLRNAINSTNYREISSLFISKLLLSFSNKHITYNKIL